MTFESKIRRVLSVCPGSVTSGKRSRKRNKQVGGVSTSMHLLGLAKDIVLDDRARDFWLFKALCKRLKLFVLDEGDHIHVQEIL